MSKPEIKKVFSCWANASKLTTLSDGTIRAQLDFQEIAPEEEPVLFSIRKKLVLVIIAESNVKLNELDIPEPPKLDHGELSKAQRLRQAIFALWKNTGQTKGSEEFYNETMETLIEWVKERI